MKKNKKKTSRIKKVFVHLFIFLSIIFIIGIGSSMFLLQRHSVIISIPGQTTSIIDKLERHVYAYNKGIYVFVMSQKNKDLFFNKTMYTVDDLNTFQHIALLYTKSNEKKFRFSPAFHEIVSKGLGFYITKQFTGEFIWHRGDKVQIQEMEEESKSPEIKDEDDDSIGRTYDHPGIELNINQEGEKIQI